MADAPALRSRSVPRRRAVVPAPTGGPPMTRIRPHAGSSHACLGVLRTATRSACAPRSMRCVPPAASSDGFGLAEPGGLRSFRTPNGSAQLHGYE
jgi:hypothetical protein